MRTKNLYIVWCLILILVLEGCSGKKEEPENALLYEDEIEEGHDYIVVGFAQVGSESDWRMANTASFQATFREENGYYLLFEDGQQKQENQIKAIRNFILQEVDYIILDPIVETGWDAVLEEARAAGIPVILSDRSVEVSDETLYTCWVGSDFEEEGRVAGRWLADYLKKEGRDEEEIRIIRTKKFDIKPMYPEDACIQMELLGHSFFVFCNAETDQVNVVYKRKGNTYGLIEPEY